MATAKYPGIGSVPKGKGGSNRTLDGPGVGSMPTRRDNKTMNPTNPAGGAAHKSMGGGERKSFYPKAPTDFPSLAASVPRSAAPGNGAKVGKSTIFDNRSGLRKQKGRGLRRGHPTLPPFGKLSEPTFNYSSASCSTPPEPACRSPAAASPPDLGRVQCQNIHPSLYLLDKYSRHIQQNSSQWMGERKCSI